MIILDTNVVSEVMRSRPHPAVIDWLDQLDSIDIFITAITATELRLGARQMALGAHQRSIAAAVESLINATFDGQVLPFGAESTVDYASIVMARVAIGRPISVQDAQIAAIAAVHEAVLATRNTKDFESTGLTMVNPWSV